MIDLQEYKKQQQQQSYDILIKKRVLKTMLNNLTKAYTATDFFYISGNSMRNLMMPGVMCNAIGKIRKNRAVHYYVIDKEIFQEIYKKYLTN